MSEYIPYTIDNDKEGVYNYNCENSYRSITDKLEEVRKLILELRDKNLYSAEMQQAVLSVENAILYSNHYYDRRAKLGIYHLPIPEDITPTFEYLSKQPRKNLTISFVADDKESPTLEREISLGNTYVQRELPLIFILIENITGKSPKYFISHDEDDDLAITFSVPKSKDGSLGYMDLDKIRDYIDSLSVPDDVYKTGVSELRFINLGKPTDNGYETITYKFSQDDAAYFSIYGSTAGSNRLRYLTIELSEYFNKELFKTLIGDPTKPGLFIYVDEQGKINQNTFLEYLDSKVKELISRNFV